jgi:hypothetical protein
MRPSFNDFDDFSFDQIESLRRRARNRDLALQRVKARKHHVGPGNDEDFDDDWADDFDDDFDDYDEDEWDRYA